VISVVSAAKQTAQKLEVRSERNMVIKGCKGIVDGYKTFNDAMKKDVLDNVERTKFAQLVFELAQSTKQVSLAQENLQDLLVAIKKLLNSLNKFKFQVDIVSNKDSSKTIEEAKRQLEEVEKKKIRRESRKQERLSRRLLEKEVNKEEEVMLVVEELDKMISEKETDNNNSNNNGSSSGSNSANSTIKIKKGDTSPKIQKFISPTKTERDDQIGVMDFLNKTTTDPVSPNPSTSNVNNIKSGNANNNNNNNKENKKKIAFMKKNKNEIHITRPFEVTHDIHVDYKLEGLPKEWETLLKQSGILIEDAKKNVDTLKNVISFNNKIKTGKIMPLPN